MNTSAVSGYYVIRGSSVYCDLVDYINGLNFSDCYEIFQNRNHLYGDQMINFNPDSIMYQPSPLVDSHSKISSNFQDTITSVPNDLLDPDLDKS